MFRFKMELATDKYELGQDESDVEISLDKPKVCILEKDEEMKEVLELYMEMLEYEVVDTNGWSNQQDIYKTFNKVEYFIIDQYGHETSTFDLSRKIRKQIPNAKIILLTDLFSEENEHSHALGIKNLNKPFDLEQLVKVLQELKK